MHKDVERLLFTEGQINEKVSELAKKITEDYKDKEPLLIGILKGCAPFMTDLMRKIELGKSGLQVPTVAVGCMRISDMSEKEVSAFVDTALGLGANFFDHADIYGGGKSESVFGSAVLPSMREKLIIQTKCGIRQGRFDFSYEHITESVNGSLKRLGTDYIDVLLLHRPDALMEPDEVAKAFDELKASGKVRHFGVSNQNPSQIQLLANSLDL